LPTYPPSSAPPSADHPAPASVDFDRTRDQLNLLWQLTIDRLTDLSVELYGLDDDADTDTVAALESRLAATRRRLVEVETALHRLRAAPVLVTA
jgi:hypothetical protein